jgi:hypothetical protein
VFHALDLGNEAPVVREERRARLETAFDERGAQEDLAASFGTIGP